LPRTLQLRLRPKKRSGLGYNPLLKRRLQF
jgi:hypothetical protein